MKMNAKKRFLSWMIAFLMVFTYVPAAAYAEDNAEGTAEAAVTETAAETEETGISVLDGQVLVTDSTGTGYLDGDIVTITAPGAFPGQPVANVINIYNKSGKAATLTFDYVAENYREDGFSEALADSTYSVLLEPDEYATMSITGKRSMSDNTATLKLSNFELEFAEDASQVTFSYESAFGTVYADGETAADGAVKDVAYAEGTALEAVPADGYEFLGWVYKDTGRIISRDAAYTLKPTKDISVEAVFSGENSETYYLVGDQYLMTGFNESAAKAAGLVKKTTVLMKDTTLEAGSYTIPAGVTFLVPFDDENTLFYEPSMDSGISTWGNYETPYTYRTLTLAEGANITVNGKLSLSAQHNAASGGGRASTSPTGPVSFIDMESGSKITVNNGATFYAYGYVTGEGTVTAKNGSTVYELFQVEDFRGGGASATMAMNNMDKGVLPLSQYYIQNIEVPLTLEAGATEYVYASFFMTQSSLGAAVPFIGGPTAMFYLSDGYVTKSYDGSTDRLIVEADGTMSLSPITVEFSGQTLNSRDFDLGINSNISVILRGGEVTINQDIAMLPGSEISIEEGAECTLSSGTNVFIYDADQWGGFCGSNNQEFVPVSYAPGRTYERTSADLVDASVKVNGKLDATKGYIYTTTDEERTSGHANIYSTANGVVELTSGEQDCTYQFTQSETEGTFHEIKLLPANLKNEDGSFVQTDGGEYTYVDIAWQCGHEAVSEEVITEPGCETEGVKLITCSEGHQYKAVIPATGHTEVIDEAVEGTCTVDAKTEGSHCGVCGEVLKKQIVTAAPGHTEVVIKGTPATCTEGGISDGRYCLVCNEELAKQEVLDPLGHNWVVEGIEPTCTLAGFGSSVCTGCGEAVEDSVIPALGHNFDWETVKEPGCETAGIRAGKCTREGCEMEAVEAIAAPGHEAVHHEAVTATCTADGCEEYWTCETCGGIFEDEDCSVELAAVPVIKAAGHDMKAVRGEAAGCTEDGHSQYWTCTVCSGVFADANGEAQLDSIPEVKATGHNAAKVDAAEAACTKDGNDEYWICTACGGIYTDEECSTALAEVPVIKAAGHETVKTEAMAATCTVAGSSEYWTCEVCGSIFEDADCSIELAAIPVIKAAGHVYGEEQYQAPTADADGGWYKVCADCGDKQWTKVRTWAEYVKAGIEATTVTATATASLKTETITVKWTKTGDFAVTYYNVYRSKTGKDGSFAKIGTSTTAAYTDKTAKPGTQYYYRVRGVRTLDGKNYLTQLSNKPYAKIKKVTAAYVKETKMVIRSYYAGKAIKVTWTSPRIKVDGFEIWRSKSLNGKYTKIKTTKTDARQWTNTGLKLQSRWYYKVRGYKIIDGKKVYTQWSKKGYRYVLNAANAKLANAIEDADAITAKKATKVSGGIKVTWTKDNAVKCNRYEIWRSTSKNGTYTKIATTKNMNYTDKSGKLKSGKRYYYKIVGYRFFGKACPTTKASNAVSAVK